MLFTIATKNEGLKIQNYQIYYSHYYYYYIHYYYYYYYCHALVAKEYHSFISYNQLQLSQLLKLVKRMMDSSYLFVKRRLADVFFSCTVDPCLCEANRNCRWKSEDNHIHWVVLRDSHKQLVDIQRHSMQDLRYATISTQIFHIRECPYLTQPSLTENV